MTHLVTRKNNTSKRTNSLLRQAVAYPVFQSALDFRRNGADSFLEQRLELFLKSTLNSQSSTWI